MDRTFIRDLGRYKIGQTFPWPRGTWERCLQSDAAKKAGFKTIDDFSRPVDDVARAGAKAVAGRAS